MSQHSDIRPAAESSAYVPRKTSASHSDDVARSLMADYPGRVPVFCKRGRRDVPDIARSKFLVPGSMCCAEFKYMVHRQLRHGGNMGFTDTIYLFLDNVSPKGGSTMSELYER